MKAALFLAGIFTCAGVAAQQAPAAATPAPRTIPKAAPASARASDGDVAELLRAQAGAIKALSAKIDALEIRLGNLEMKQP